MFQAAIDAGAAIRPVTLRYREGAESSTRAAFVGGDSLLSSLMRITATRHLVAEVRLPGLVPHAAATRAELTRFARPACASACRAHTRPRREEKAFDAAIPMVGACLAGDMEIAPLLRAFYQEKA